MPLIYQDHILRSDLQANPERFYVFGDNVQSYGRLGQAAEMRGELNAIGIPTKWFPKMTPKAFFWDHQRPEILPILEPVYAHIIGLLEAGSTVVWPSAGIGSGLSRLPTYAPNLWAEMERIRTDLLETL